MNIPQRLQMLLNELGQRMGLSGLSFDTDGGCALELDQRMIISLQCHESGDELWLYTDLGPVRGRSPALHEKLLQANLFWQQTSGATFSLSGDQPPHAVLAHALHWMPMDEASLVAAVENFVNTAEDWQARLELAETDTAVDPVDAPLGHAMDLLLRSRA